MAEQTNSQQCKQISSAKTNLIGLQSQKNDYLMKSSDFFPISDNKFENQDYKLDDPKLKQDDWKHSQIKKIFSLYAEYGSQWKILQTQFPQRSSNSIKNRFYTIVRAFLKALFREHPKIDKKFPSQIPSKVILRFYEGREEFIKFKGFGKRLLKILDYDIESKKLKKVVAENLQELIILYNLIFPTRVATCCPPRTQTPIEQKNYFSHSSKRQEWEEQLDIEDGQKSGDIVNYKTGDTYISREQRIGIAENMFVINLIPMNLIFFPTEVTRPYFQ